MIEIIKGDHVYYSLNIKKANVSLYTFKLQIRPTNNGDSLLFESTPDLVDMSKSEDGIVVFSIPSNKTSNFGVNSAVLGVYYTDENNFKKTVVTREEVKIINPVAR